MPQVATPGGAPTSVAAVLSRARGAFLAAESYHVHASLQGGTQIVEATVESASNIVMTGTFHVPGSPGQDSSFMSLGLADYVMGSGLLSDLAGNVAHRAGTQWVSFAFDDASAKVLASFLKAIRLPFDLVFDPQAPDSATVTAAVDSRGRAIHTITEPGVSVVLEDSDGLPIAETYGGNTVIVDGYGLDLPPPSMPPAVTLNALLGP